jgi:hypothetical protein
VGEKFWQVVTVVGVVLMVLSGLGLIGVGHA